MGYTPRRRRMIRSSPWTPSPSSRLSGLAGSALRYSLRAGSDYLRRRSSTASTRSLGSSVRSGVVTTVQKDVRTQYSKTSQPKWKRRRWGKFVKKVHAATESEQGTVSVVRNATLVTTTSSGQQYQTPVLYGINGGNFVSSSGNDDVQTVKASDNRIDTTSKIKFTAGVMDITMRNLPPEAGVGSDMELDIYEVLYTSETKKNNCHEIIEQAQTTTATTTPSTGTNAGLTLLQRGATPFEFPLAIKNGGIRILKKTKIFLPVGDTTTYQVRDPKTHFMTSNEFEDTTGFIKPWVTRGIIAVFKPVVGATTEVTLASGVTRIYRYKIVQDNKTFDAYRVQAAAVAAAVSVRASVRAH